MVIVKRRDASYNWAVYHSGIDATAPEDYWMSLDTSNARASNTTIWGSTAPTSTTVKVGWLNETNANNGTYIAYCFAEVKGYSKFGFYVANNSADGPFIHTGFTPAWVLVKATTVGDGWYIRNTAVNTYNPVSHAIDASSAAAEANYTSYPIDILSNGFKFRGNGYGNGGTNTYIWAAFAEHPFGGDGVSPATAR